MFFKGNYIDEDRILGVEHNGLPDDHDNPKFFSNDQWGIVTFHFSGPGQRQIELYCTKAEYANVILPVVKELDNRRKSKKNK